MILFVASNPSHLNSDPNEPFTGSKSEPIFQKWVRLVMPHGEKHNVINVADTVTPGNRPLKKSEINVFELNEKVFDNRPTKIVALGTTAAMALEMAGLEFFKLPHPSPKNRFLNNKVQVSAVLEECSKWLKG